MRKKTIKALILSFFLFIPALSFAASCEESLIEINNHSQHKLQITVSPTSGAVATNQSPFTKELLPGKQLSLLVNKANGDEQIDFTGTVKIKSYESPGTVTLAYDFHSSRNFLNSTCNNKSHNHQGNINQLVINSEIIDGFLKTEKVILQVNDA